MGMMAHFLQRTPSKPYTRSLRLLLHSKFESVLILRWKPNDRVGRHGWWWLFYFIVAFHGRRCNRPAERCRVGKKKPWKSPFMQLAICT